MQENKRGAREATGAKTTGRPRRVLHHEKQVPIQLITDPTMISLKSAFAALFLILTSVNATVAHSEPADDAMVRALIEEGLTHDQAVRVRDKVLKSEESNANPETKMDKPQTTETPKRFPVVPTTKILAIGRFTTPPTPEQVKEFFPKEVPATLQLYLDGKIDQWWVRQDQTGPLFLMNVTTVAEARSILEKLPLGQAKLMEFDYIELGPLSPLHLLLSEGWAKGTK